MQEVIAGIMGEAEALHQVSRSLISDGGEGDELTKVQAGEGIVSGLLCRGEGDAAPPKLPAQPPADLNAGGEVSGEPRLCEAGESGELSLYLNRPQSPAAFINALAKALHGLAGFLEAERTWEEPHDLAVGIHGGEGLQVGVKPLA